jgi:hypothetical protein
VKQGSEQCGAGSGKKCQEGIRAPCIHLLQQEGGGEDHDCD